MTLKLISEAIAKDKIVQGALSDLDSGLKVRLAVTKSSIPYLAATVAESRPVVLIASTERAAQDLANALTDFVSEENIAVFPAWETLPHERLSPSSDTVGRRMAVLRRLAHPNEVAPISVLVTSARAFIQPIVAGLGDVPALNLATGDDFSLERLVTELSRLGFDRVDLVDRRASSQSVAELLISFHLH